MLVTTVVHCDTYSAHENPAHPCYPILRASGASPGQCDWLCAEPPQEATCCASPSARPVSLLPSMHEPGGVISSCGGLSDLLALSKSQTPTLQHGTFPSLQGLAQRLLPPGWSPVPGWPGPVPHTYSSRPEFVLRLTGQNLCVKFVCVHLGGLCVSRWQEPVTAPGCSSPPRECTSQWKTGRHGKGRPPAS